MYSAQRLARVLLVMGLLAAGFALFGPSERWGGVDLGATGAVLFMFSLAAAIWLCATRSEEIFPESMSIAERRAWVGLVFIVVILATFARELLVLSGDAVIPERIHDLFAHGFMQRYLVLVLAWAVVSHLVGRDGGVAVDERDMRMQHRAGRAADWALTLIVVVAIVVLVSVPRASMSWWLAPVVLANVLLGLLMVKSLVEHVVLAIAYRSPGPVSS